MKPPALPTKEQYDHRDDRRKSHTNSMEGVQRMPLQLNKVFSTDYRNRFAYQRNDTFSPENVPRQTKTISPAPHKPYQNDDTDPKRAASEKMPIRSSSFELDFSVFESIYKNYSKIWGACLKLPQHDLRDRQLVDIHDFKRILKDTDSSENQNVLTNVLVEFLLTSSVKKEGKLLDTRLFFNSVFLTLKRTKNNKSGSFNAEMFIVDHFWNISFPANSHGSGLSPRPSDHHTPGGSSSQGTPTHSQEPNDSQHVDIEFFQAQLFTVFTKGNNPLLSVPDCERLMTECFKFLMQKNKIKKHISKRTVKKVVFRSCHGLLLRGLIGLHDRIQVNYSPVKWSSDLMNMPRQSTNLAHQFNQHEQENNNHYVAPQNGQKKRLNYYCEDYSVPGTLTQTDSSLSMCRQLEVRLMVERLNSSIGHVQKRISFETLSKNRFYRHQQHVQKPNVFDYSSNLMAEMDQRYEQQPSSSHRRYKSKIEPPSPIMNEQPQYPHQEYASSQNHYASQDTHPISLNNYQDAYQSNFVQTTHPELNAQYSQSHQRPLSYPGQSSQYHSINTDQTLVIRPREGHIISSVPKKIETINSEEADPSNMNYQQMADDTILDNMRCLRQLDERISELKNSSQGSHSPKPSAAHYSIQKEQYAASLQYSYVADDEDKSPEIYCGEEQVYEDQEQVYEDQTQVYGNEEQVYGDEEQVYADEEQVYQDEERVYADEEQVYEGSQPSQISYQNYMVNSQSGRTPYLRYPLISSENQQPVLGYLNRIRPHYESNLVIEHEQNIVSDSQGITEQQKYLRDGSFNPSDQKIIVQNVDQHMHLASAELTSSLATDDMAPPSQQQQQQQASNELSSSVVCSDERQSRLSTMHMIQKMSGEYLKNDPIDSQQSLFHQAQSLSVQQNPNQRIQYVTRPLCERESSRASMQFASCQAQKIKKPEGKIYVSTTQEDHTQESLAYPQTRHGSCLTSQENHLEQQREQTEHANQRISTGADVMSTDPLTSDGEILLSSQSRSRYAESTAEQNMNIQEKSRSKDGRKKKKKQRDQACMGECKDAVLYEKKYRKAKQKARSLIREKEDEEGRSQRLVTLNTDLTERNENLDNHVMQATQALQHAQQEQERLIEVQKITSMQYAFLNIARIRTKTDFLEEQANLNRSFNDWKDQAYISKVEKFYQTEIVAIKRWIGIKELFSQWKVNAALKAKQEESLLLRKVVLQRMITRQTYSAKQRVFRVWQGPLMNSSYVKGMKYDFYKVVDSLKIMRSALFVEKMKSLQQKYHNRNVQFGFSGLSAHAQSMNQLEVMREQMSKSLAMHNQSQQAVFSGHKLSKQQHHLSHSRVQSSGSRRRPASILMTSINQQKRKSTSPVISEQQRVKIKLHNGKNKRYHEESEADFSREMFRSDGHQQNTSTDFVVEGSFKELSRKKQRILRKQEYEFQKQKVRQSEENEEETPTEASDDILVSSRSAGKRERYTYRVRQLRNQSAYIEAFTKLYSLENKFSNAMNTNAKFAFFEQWKAVTFQEEEEVSQTNYNYNGEIANYAANKSQFTENEKSQAFDTFNSGMNHSGMNQSSHRSTSFRSQGNQQFERPPKPTFQGQKRRVQPMMQMEQTHYQQQQFQLPAPQAQSMHDTTQDSEFYYQHPQISANEEQPQQNFDKQKRAVTPQNVPHRYTGPQVKHVGSVRHLYSSKAQHSMFQLCRGQSKGSQMETEIVSGGGKIMNSRLNSNINSAGNISQPGIGTNSNGSRSSTSTKVISILGPQRQPFTFLQQTPNSGNQQRKHKNQHKKFVQKRAL